MNPELQKELGWWGGGFFIDCVGGWMSVQPLWVILCCLWGCSQRKGEKKIEEIVEEMKERDREERGTGMKVKKQEILIKTFSLYPFLLQG